jgi:hypothetical protein
MASHLINLPNPDLPLPLRIFENEWVLTIALGTLLVAFVVYQQWKGLESERLPIPKLPRAVTTDDFREAFRKEILAHSPESATFGDDIAKSLRRYVGHTAKIRLSPTETVEQMKIRLPEDLWDVFVRIRDIRYAPKGGHSDACVTVQDHIIELLDQHAI